MKKYHISIIDPVGCKSGMDDYNTFLAKALEKKNIFTTIFSNFSNKKSKNISYKSYYEGFSTKTILTRILGRIWATIKSTIESKKLKTDLTIIHLFEINIRTFFIFLIPKLFFLKTAIIVHDVSSFHNKDQKILQYLTYNYLSDNLIVHNEYSHEFLLNTKIVKYPNKIKIIKHGGYLDSVHDLSYDKNDIKAELGFDQNLKYLLFFGQLKDNKGLEILIKSMININKDIHLIIAGREFNNNFSNYEELISKYDLTDRIHSYIRFINKHERDKLFVVSDLLVLPYKKVYQSGVLLLAMSHGLPVIASDLPPNTDIIKHEDTGFLFENENVDELSNRINKYIDNSKLLDKVSGNAIQIIGKKYGVDSIAQEYVQLFMENIN